jgi:hypothetical protein
MYFLSGVDELLLNKSLRNTSSLLPRFFVGVLLFRVAWMLSLIVKRLRLQGVGSPHRRQRDDG